MSTKTKSNDIKEKTICLVMIVKNESKTLPRLFESLYKYIDYWCIHDTGSTDGTPDYIVSYFKEKGIKGELFHNAWKNFGHNRTLAIKSAFKKADYCLLFDADFVLKVQDPDFKKKLGDADGYLLNYEGNLDYRQNLLVRGTLPWEYKGVTHEFVYVPGKNNVVQKPLNGITIDHKADGGSRDNKFQRDIELLEQGLKDEPDNGRYYFYLAQSHKDLGSIAKREHEMKFRLQTELAKKITESTQKIKELQSKQMIATKNKDPSDPNIEKELTNQTALLARYKTELEKTETALKTLEKDFMTHYEKAIPNYQKRYEIGGWEEECYYSLLQIGMIKMAMNKSFHEFMPDLLRAFTYRKSRLEALFNLVRFCRLNKMAELGYGYGRLAAKNQYPSDLLFIDKSIHEWGFWDELALCAHMAGDHVMALEIGQKLIREKKYPESQKERLEKNIEYFTESFEKHCKAINSKLAKPLVEAKPESTNKSDESSKKTTDSSSNKSTTESSGKPTSAELTKWEFVRTDPKNKQNRVAVIVANYNMLEKANAHAEYIKKHVKYPCDLILVDNASDLTPVSPYTTIRVARNVQTCHAWLTGLNYCDSLEVIEGFKYFAYAFVITSSEILPNQGDLIQSLVNPLINNQTVVGIHPALSEDSTTHWKQLYHRGMGLRMTNMIDNIYSMYRADWFNSIGRFDPKQTYAWGIDMETSYFARRDGKKILVNDDVQIRKISDIGYTMNRMNMSSQERFNNARKQLEEVFTAKYGPEYNNAVSMQHRIPELLQFQPTLAELTSQYAQNESGQRVLMDYIARHRTENEVIFKKQTSTHSTINLIEIGSTREELVNSNSSYKLSVLAREFGYRFYSVDMDPESIALITRMIDTDRKLPNGELANHLVNARAEDYFATFKDPIHYVYLDGFDFSLNENHHNADRKRRYKTYLNCEITNEGCYQMHLDTVKLLHPLLVQGSVLAITNVENLTDYKWKGLKAVPYLIETGCYKILEHRQNVLLLQKTKLDSTPPTESSKTTKSTTKLPTDQNEAKPAEPKQETKPVAETKSSEAKPVETKPTKEELDGDYMQDISRHFCKDEQCKICNNKPTETQKSVKTGMKIVQADEHGNVTITDESQVHPIHEEDLKPEVQRQMAAEAKPKPAESEQAEPKPAEPKPAERKQIEKLSKKIGEIVNFTSDPTTLSQVDQTKDEYIVTLLGYTNATQKHTNWFPWNRFLDVFKTRGYQAEWRELNELVPRITESNPKPRIFICWNSPTCVELLRSGVVFAKDVVIQKLTSLGKGMESVNWGNDPKTYFKSWNWPIYQTVEYLYDHGFNIYAFGCHSQTENFPEKHRICQKLEKAGRLFWINWGSTMFNEKEIQASRPVMGNNMPVLDNHQFALDLGFVGSKWGQAGRGNTDQWDAFVEPIIKTFNNQNQRKAGLFGAGQPNGMVSDEDAKKILRNSKLCPIIHAPSWVAEEGIQDRFYSVFTAGRFGVCDNIGAYQYFNSDEVVCELNPEQYVAKSKYYLDNPKEQLPYIEKVQKKIKEKYNLYHEWDNLLRNILQDQLKNPANETEYYYKLNSIYQITTPFFSKKISE